MDYLENGNKYNSHKYLTIVFIKSKSLPQSNSRQRKLLASKQKDYKGNAENP